MIDHFEQMRKGKMRMRILSLFLYQEHESKRRGSQTEGKEWHEL
ncbi:hypothetical protein NY10_1733 [Carnobacterium antarcticum]|nr:hypothetical protein NY10_1733 [Carnobacterium sp. CP1]